MQTLEAYTASLWLYLSSVVINAINKVCQTNANSDAVMGIKIFQESWYLEF